VRGRRSDGANIVRVTDTDDRERDAVPEIDKAAPAINARRTNKKMPPGIRAAPLS
jgi:hypothetical protein